MINTGEESPPSPKIADGAIFDTGSLAPAKTPANIKLASAAKRALFIVSNLLYLLRVLIAGNKGHPALPSADKPIRRLNKRGTIRRSLLRLFALYERQTQIPVTKPRYQANAIDVRDGFLCVLKTISFMPSIPIWTYRVHHKTAGRRRC